MTGRSQDQSSQRDLSNAQNVDRKRFLAVHSQVCERRKSMSDGWFKLPDGAPGTEPGFLGRPATELEQWFIQTFGYPLPIGGDIHWSTRVDSNGNLIDPHTTLQGPGGFRTRLP